MVDKNILIEVDGQSHYQPVRYGGISQEIAEKNFASQQIRDAIKTEYCLNRGIQLLRIPYYVIDRNEIVEFIKNNI